MTASDLRQILCQHPGLELGAGLDAGAVANAEQALGFRLPRELAEFLSEVNGVFDGDGQWHVAWPVDRLVQENIRLAEDQHFPPGLVVFGDDGTGAPFCLGIDGSDEVVYTYSPIEARAWPLASRLSDFWLGWLSGTLTT